MTPVRARRGLCALVASLAIAGCATSPGLQDSPARAQPVAGSDSWPAVAAAERRGSGGYERTTVPPGFLVLMLGVPLVILLL